MSEVQALVDALAAELGRPVGVDDRRFRSIAYSPQPEGVDAVRLASILQREAPLPVREWLESLNVGEGEPYVRVPANRELEMAARVCVPLRFDRMPLGYLWLIDEPDPLSEEELREAGRYAEEFGVALYRERVLERDESQRERELAGTLIGLRDGDPAAAAAELLRAGYLAQEAGYGVLALRALHAERSEAPSSVRVRLADSAEQLRRSVAPHHLLVLPDGGEVALVVASSSAAELGRRAEALAAAAPEHLAGAPAFTPQVGVGGWVADAAGLAASHWQARAAARVSAAIGIAEPIASWEELGAYRTVAVLLDDRDPGELLPGSFRLLLESSEAETLIATLEAYLDLGGDARAAAERLFLHRSSLYGRLHRIEEIAGVDLHSGEDRLELHLGLRLWRLGAGHRGT